MQVQLMGLLFISTVRRESTVQYVHPAPLVTDAAPARNLLCQILETKEKVFLTPKTFLPLLINYKLLGNCFTFNPCAEAFMKLHHVRQVCSDAWPGPAHGSSPKGRGRGWQRVSSRTPLPLIVAFPAEMKWFLVETKRKKMVSISAFGSFSALLSAFTVYRYQLLL